MFFLLEKCVSNSIAESVQILTFSWVLVTGSDYDRDEALESVVPSAKETATQLMEAAMDALAKDLAKLRTGRASPGTLQNPQCGLDSLLRICFLELLGLKVSRSMTATCGQIMCCN